MSSALKAAVSVLMLGAVPTSSGARAPVALNQLTVPQEQLPSGCVAAPSDKAGLPIDRNPWVGNDRRVVGAIRERMDGPVRVPDGPPATRRELSQYRLQLADGVEEAYAAVYRQPDPAQGLIVVYGSTLSDAAARAARQGFARPSENPKIIRLTMGSTVVVLHGDGGPCSQAIGAYLQSLSHP